MTTNTSEKGLESITVASLVQDAGYVQGAPQDFDWEHAVDLAKLLQFLSATQPEAYRRLESKRRAPSAPSSCTACRARSPSVVWWKCCAAAPSTARLMWIFSTAYRRWGNVSAAERFAANIFSVTRQLRCSRIETALSLDMAVFINDLPIATFQLKNKLTKQTVLDAVQQYQRDRDPKELLFQFGRCAVHFAVDDHEVRFRTHLKGKSSWFLPFNKGYNDGAGNPPNPHGLPTDYLWNARHNSPTFFL